MSNTTVPALRSDVAKNLLAESVWIGRDFANALRGSFPVTEAKAQEYLPELRRKIEKMVYKHVKAISAEDMSAMMLAARAPFLRRMTGED